MTYKTPEQPENSYRITLELSESQPRLDITLMDALKAQDENIDMKNVTKSHLKKLFAEKKVLIKGQSARAKSSINKGVTHIDILL